MRVLDQQLTLTASDLSAHSSCPHLTSLERSVAAGRLEKTIYEDRSLIALQQRGEQHEVGYADHLRTSGRDILEIEEPGVTDGGARKTEQAMRDGADVITQAHLMSGRWRGRADFLVKVDRACDLGAWSYEVQDTKLARETKGGTILQLSLYSEVVGEIQGLQPDQMYVVRPGTDYVPDTYRVAEYAAYYRYVKAKLENAVDDPQADIATYPEPCAHCDICDWRIVCARQRRADDHLSLVAGINRSQRRELVGQEIETLQRLSEMALPVPFKPDRGSVQGLERVREQARVQVQGRDEKRPVHEVLVIEEGRGFCRLPEPSDGDVFFDLEGDPFVGDGGREYLFGWASKREAESFTVESAGDAERKPGGEAGDDRLLDPGADKPGAARSDDVHYRAIWVWTAEEEKEAFEAFIDEMMGRIETCPDFHIYHYAPYEPAALKRLMGRYGTREEEVDRLLRGGKFVDLYAVARQAVRASVEKYSIKDLEPFFGFERETDLHEANDQRHALQIELELDHVDAITQEMRDTVESYNRDDCVSTLRLRDWLEQLRSDEMGKGIEIPRPKIESDEPTEKVLEEEARVRELVERLTADVPADPDEHTDEQKARWLLAQLLEFHRREDKAAWWEFFRLRDFDDEEMLDERHAISGLELIATGKIKRSVSHTYRFPEQETSVREGNKLKTAAIEKGDYGEVHAFDPVGRTIEIKKTRNSADMHATAVFLHDYIPKPAQKQSLFQLGEWVAENGVDAPGFRRAGRDLLLGMLPRFVEPQPAGASLRMEDEATLDAAKRLGLALTDGALAIQGSPGSGKTFTGAYMILEMAEAGKKVGITAVSHKVIQNLLDTVIEVADEVGRQVSCVVKVSEVDEEDDHGAIEQTGDNARVFEALNAGEASVGAGTAWLWSRDEYSELLDVLFVDEAGQMSLADVLAVSQSARNVVLLGDPQQLEQPMQGSHPDGSEVSALQHLLGENKTFTPDQGLFLDETWRLHPNICSFTSGLFYESKLSSRDGLENQLVLREDAYGGAGLWFVPVEHSGCVNTSPEEVEAIVELVEMLTKSQWRDKDRVEKPITLNDILIVAPYNAQVNAISDRIPEARVGTVDRFQGQEAPAVIYSMTTSIPEDAPRGMKFLYSLSRLNVATTRARCAVFLVASPKLLEVECRSPKQMRLANAFCAYVEGAREIVK